MPILNLSQFTGGLLNRPAPQLLDPAQATVANDCLIDTGAITPLNASAVVGGTVGLSTTSIYKFAGAWLGSTQDRYYAEDNNILYYANGGPPMKRSSFNGVSPVPTHVTPGTEVRMGILAPPAAVSAGKTAAGTANIGVPAAGLSYIVTFYSDPLLSGGWGGESGPSVALTVAKDAVYFQGVALSATDTAFLGNIIGAAGLAATGTLMFDSGEMVSYTGGASPSTPQVLTITRGVNGTTPTAHNSGEWCVIVAQSIDLTIPVSADPQVNARRIWRLYAGQYHLVGEVNDNTTVTFHDTTAPNYLSSTVLTIVIAGIPPNLTGICGPYNGMLFGWVLNTLYVSYPGQYDNWNTLYNFTFRTPIAWAGVLGGYLVVLTEQGPFTITGSDPSALTKSEALSSEGCLQGHTAVRTGRHITYLGINGVTMFDGVSSQVVSNPSLTLAFTQNLAHPKAAYFQQHYYLFHDAGCLIGDFRAAPPYGSAMNPIWRTSSETCTAVHFNPFDDALYLGKGGQINQWGTGAPLPWSYSTGELALNDLAQSKNFHTLTVHASGDVLCTLTIDGATYHTKQLHGARRPTRMRLTGVARGYRPTIALSGTGTVYGVEVEYTGPLRSRTS